MSKKRRKLETGWRDTSKNEFLSQLEAFQPAQELLFPLGRAFGRYRKYLEPASRHPAKMDSGLIGFLVKKYSRTGDVVLDPMAGSGSVGVVAAALGRDAFQIELVRKFYGWMNEAADRLAADYTIGNKGRITNLCADARNTSKLVGQEIADLIIFSPPYCDQNHYSDLSSRLGQLARSKTTGVGKQAAQGKFRFSYSRSKRNIGNLKGEKYLEEMRKVYAESYKALKQEGLATVAVRPLYRKKTVLDLPDLTWRLLKDANFEMVSVYKLMLIRQSFWTRLYEKKHPEVPKIRHEYVLVVRRPREIEDIVHVCVSSRERARLLEWIASTTKGDIE